MRQRRLIYGFFDENRPALLIVLDACRYDYLADRLSGVEPVESAGTCTPDWLRRTFRHPLDVVYVSANAWVSLVYRGGPGPFGRVVDVSSRHWDGRRHTVHPKWVNLAALRYVFRGVSLMVHYVQPHAPVIEPRWLSRNPDMALPADLLYERMERDRGLLARYREGYAANLDYVLDYALRLAAEARGRGYRVAITADHGELLEPVYAPVFQARRLFRRNMARWLAAALPYVVGYRRLVGHPCGFEHPDLVTVPWWEPD